MPNDDKQPLDLVRYVDEAKNDAIHAFGFLRDSGSLSASLTFGVTHKIAGHDKVLQIRFPQPWAKDRVVKVTVADASEHKDLVVLAEPRLEADTFIHAHTPYLSAWSLAHKPFPILYVAAQRHLLAREIPNHLERTRSVLDVIRERLDKRPELAPPPGILESNGGANFWGKGILKTAELILLIEEAAKFQSLAEAIGGAKPYTPGALELQWKRTGLLERARQYEG